MEDEEIQVVFIGEINTGKTSIRNGLPIYNEFNSGDWGLGIGDWGLGIGDWG